MNAVDRIETIFAWLGAIGALVTLGALFYVIWRGMQRSTGRTVGWATSVLRQPLFYILLSLAFFGFCYLLWRPFPLSPSLPASRLALAAGALTFFAGLGLVLWGRLVLAQQYFVSTIAGTQLFAGHRLVTTGPFALVRHPIYLGILLAGLGGILLYRTWTMSFITLMGIGLRVCAHREEQVLADEFGQDWLDYCRRVSAFLPRISRWHSPKSG